MKKLFLTLSLINISFISAQQNKVGINTDSPIATLDVEGTVRLAKPGEPTSTDNIVPLGINPSNKKLEKLDVANGNPLQHKRITKTFSNVSDSHFSFQKRFDLGITNPNDYEVVLLSAQLTTSSGAPFMKIYSVTDQQQYRENGNWYLIGTTEGKAKKNILSPVVITNSAYGDILASGELTERDGKPRPHILQGKLSSTNGAPGRGESNLFMFAIPNNKVFKQNGRWYFEGGYQFASALASNLTWTVDVLIINKNWVEVAPVKNVTVN